MKKPVSSSLVPLIEQQLDAYFALHGDSLPESGLYDRIMQEIERVLLQKTLHAVEGNQLKAAKILGINRNTLRKKIKELQIEF